MSQKAPCQQDPDQDEAEEAPEDQAEYDSVLISSAGDLVAALANVTGPEFAPAFNTICPLIVKYYVGPVDFSFINFDLRIHRRKTVPSATVQPQSLLLPKSLRG